MRSRSPSDRRVPKLMPSSGPPWIKDRGSDPAMHGSLDDAWAAPLTAGLISVDRARDRAGREDDRRHAERRVEQSKHG